MTWRSRIERARRSMRVTTSVSPGWMKSRMVRSSGRPARVVPAAGLGADHGAACRGERRALGIEVLVRGGVPRSQCAYPKRSFPADRPCPPPTPTSPARV